MRKPDPIVTAATALLGAGFVAWWIAFDGTGSGRTPGVGARPAAAQEAPGGGQEAAAALTAERAITDHRTATRGPEQPIPFSHKFHVRELAIDCMYCHVGTERSDTGIVPPLEVCMGCHRVAGTGLEPIEELRGYWSREEPVPWEWVTKLPDFVQFSHRAHLRNEIACETCHGPIEQMDRVYQWAPLTMGWCLECHRSQPEATDVATDHRLARSARTARAPEERQEASLYPTTIDQRYGASRAPIDCLACHH